MASVADRSKAFSENIESNQSGAVTHFFGSMNVPTGVIRVYGGGVDTHERALF